MTAVHEVDREPDPEPHEEAQPDLHRPFRTPWVPVIPILGIATNLMLMFALGWENWLRLFVWLGIGLAIYFVYSRHHSVLGRSLAQELAQGGVSPAGRARD